MSSAETVNPTEPDQSQPTKCFDLLHLDQNDFLRLKERISAVSGTVNIMIHPYFVDDSRPASAEYIARRDAMMAGISDDKVPMLVFEEFKQIDDLKNEMEEYGGDLYLVPTELDESTLHIDGLNEDEAWGRLVAQLRGLGVKRAVVGGRILFFGGFEDSEVIADIFRLQEFEELKAAAQGKPWAESWTSKGYDPWGCVGSLARDLVQAGFDVDLSPISSPERVED